MITTNDNEPKTIVGYDDTIVFGLIYLSKKQNYKYCSDIHLYIPNSFNIENISFPDIDVNRFSVSHNNYIKSFNGKLLKTLYSYISYLDELVEVNLTINTKELDIWGCPKLIKLPNIKCKSLTLIDLPNVSKLPDVFEVKNLSIRNCPLLDFNNINVNKLIIDDLTATNFSAKKVQFDNFNSIKFV